MTKKQLLFLSLASLMFLFSGCVNESLALPGMGSSSKPSQSGNTWADETNINDVYIDDLDENNNTATESETMITEESPQSVVKRIPFPVGEYTRLARIGKGTVKGTIYITDYSGNKIPGKETRLYLNPATSYSNQWYKESYIGGKKMEKADSRLFNYLRFTASDKSGNFAFYGVPTGSYYLIGTVKCGTECGYDTPKNIRIAKKISIRGNQILEADLARPVD
ncbi:carboxypeptidase regulatory-like domain-containing protein [Sulfurovum sp.]|uniref:carboxypeptidase regulatory-like domain-containing protein n=1 Tax=Sulfurovum sp. TaxID=1969726 RepID=UPI0025FA5C97|nr:carboxypeptidase regulatory-like domain-containing protein [Sulfurovum sp.]